MNSTRTAAAAAALLILCAAAPWAGAADAPVPAAAAQAAAREGWFPARVDFNFVRAQVNVPPRPGVVIVDSRPAARQYDPGHIPGAINMPDSQFDKLLDRLPADRQTLLVFYCGGVDCMLSHQSAFRAQKLGYVNVRVYAEGIPDWKARGGPLSVSAAYLRKSLDEKLPLLLVDARPRRTAAKGMIPGAVNIPDSEFEQHVQALPADKATPIVYYCGGLDCVLSGQSAEKARKLGYMQAMTYPEGYPQWQALYGAPGDGAAAAAWTGMDAATTAALQAGHEKGSVTVASFEQALAVSAPTLLVVDVREPREFAAGSFNGAINLPINELEKKVATLPTDRPVVFVCGTGARAGEAYDTVKLLRPEVKAWFLDAHVKYEGQGRYTVAGK